MSRLARWHNSLRPMQHVALVVWVALLLGVGIRVAVSKPNAGSVMPVYLNAATRWSAGDDLYAPAPPLDLYRNPPGVAAAFVPFTWVPEKVAGLLFRGLSAAVFLTGLTLWVRHGLPRPLTPGEAGAVFTMAGPLALNSLNNGQTNLLVIGALLFGATAVARGRWLAGGLWLAVPVGLKVYPASVGGLLATAFPRRLLPWFAAGIVVVFGLPFLLGSWDYAAAQYRGLVTQTRLDDRTGGLLYRAPRDLYLVLRVWFTAPPRPVYQGTTLGVAAAMLGVVLLAAWRTRDRRFVAALGLNLGCIWMTVFGPGTEAHTYALLAPTAAAVTVLAYADRKQRGGWLAVGLAAGGAALVVSPVFRDMFPDGWKYQALGPQPVGGLMLLAAVLIDAGVAAGELNTARR